MCVKPIFEIGDVVALRLKTADKRYQSSCKISESEFRAVDGKFFIVRKVGDNVSYRSSIAPQVQDIWPFFQLFDGLFDDVPTFAEYEKTRPARVAVEKRNSVFWCEGSLVYFRRRDFQVVGSDKTGIDALEAEMKQSNSESIFFGIDNLHYNAETIVVNALLGAKK